LKKIGLIINPIAGIGGKLGLKGTDGYTLEELKKQYNATSVSNERAIAALEPLQQLGCPFQIVTYGGNMGASVADKMFDDTVCVGMPCRDVTYADDTIEAVKKIAEEGVDIMLFVGGDGTARDVYEAIGTNQICIGVPSGVKMHSAVHGLTPTKAGELARDFLLSSNMRVDEAEVMDIDEARYRDGEVFAKLYGYLKIPVDRKKTQGKKAGSHESERYFQDAIACYIIEEVMDSDTYYILGPGTTTAQIQRRLDQPFSLLGVDLVHQGVTIAKDLSERDLLEWIEGRKTKLIITPTGGQGFLLGRGNQQISSEVIRAIGKDNIMIIATKNKLLSLGPSPLYVDLDEDCNKMLRGYHKIIAGYEDLVLKKITD
jgi:predicted polyphosphate/ATP-dependent NAD kinase